MPCNPVFMHTTIRCFKLTIIRVFQVHHNPVFRDAVFKYTAMRPVFTGAAKELYGSSIQKSVYTETDNTWRNIVVPPADHIRGNEHRHPRAGTNGRRSDRGETNHMNP